ncbi:hypothetical protein EB796_001944 [Bugula neritina]|uniref:Uncharacterized protein n=1 Tax=Bugula neritina TaxID=10212 RepID=A0A7J7KNI5_BUGNE|nr:hypothetical protein EB796_001944 [Bugula neritina]
MLPTQHLQICQHTYLIPLAFTSRIREQNSVCVSPHSKLYSSHLAAIISPSSLFLALQPGEAFCSIL